MKRYAIKAAIAVTFLFSLTSCVKGVVKCADTDDYHELPSEKIDIASVNKIDNESPCDIIFTPGEPSAVFYCDKKLRDYITVEQRDSTLRLRFDRHIILMGNAHATLVVSSPSIRSIASAGSGDIDISRLTRSDFRAELAGSGDIDITDSSFDRLDVTLSGSGDIELKRVKFQFARLAMAGSGDIELKNADGDRLEGSVSGSGDIKVDGVVRVAGLCTAGAGNIDVRGLACDSIRTETNGAGEVIK